MPIIPDPRADRGGTIFAGLQWVWRTTDNGGDPTFLAANCNEFGPFTGSGKCGDWVHLGNRRLTGGTVSWVSRSSGDTGTLWAGTASGRVYIFKNADAADPSTAAQNEVSDALVANNTTPVRFISGIVIDPANPNHGWVSYGGYNASAPAGQTAVPGHVFEVTWDGVSAVATFRSLDGSGRSALGDLPVNAMVRDDATGDLYVATDFTVLRRNARTGHWHPAAEGLPMVEVSSLAVDQSTRVIYAATHGRSAWRLALK
jgi:ligand-binding sensor domain-containing protein